MKKVFGKACLDCRGMLVGSGDDVVDLAVVDLVDGDVDGLEEIRRRTHRPEVPVGIRCAVQVLAGQWNVGRRLVHRIWVCGAEEWTPKSRHKNLCDPSMTIQDLQLNATIK